MRSKSTESRFEEHIGLGLYTGPRGTWSQSSATLRRRMARTLPMLGHCRYSDTAGRYSVTVQPATSRRCEWRQRYSVREQAEAWRSAGSGLLVWNRGRVRGERFDATRVLRETWGE